MAINTIRLSVVVRELKIRLDVAIKYLQDNPSFGDTQNLSNYDATISITQYEALVIRFNGHKRLCIRYHRKFSGTYDQAINAYCEGDFKQWAYSGRLAIEEFCRFYICWICASDIEKASGILDGKQDFFKIFERPEKRPPYGKKIIGYIFQKYRPILKDFKDKSLFSTYDLLSKYVHHFETIKTSSTFDAQNVLEKIKDTENRIYKQILNIDSYYENLEELEYVLSQCEEATNTGYRDANKYLEGIDKSIQKACTIINDSIVNIKNFNLNDPTLIGKLKEQLTKVQGEFTDSFEDVKKNVKLKYQNHKKFNITLFGRTKAGKSTLMAILTHSNGDAIGKGGQRTTRDIRQYEWHGMTVTDVPGIDSYAGGEDDKLAHDAAEFADMVLFLITAGQPEYTEAKWLVNLKKMDKPIICIHNYKQNLNDSLEIELLLNYSNLNMDSEDVKEQENQFNEWIKQELPNEKIKYFIVHLLAKFKAQHEENSEQRTKLEQISRFERVEKEIISEIRTNGILYRKKSFLSIIDVPLYAQMIDLLKMSNMAYIQYRMIKDKQEQFAKWEEIFNNNEWDSINREVKKLFDDIKSQIIPGFVTDHVEDNNPNEAWKERINKLDLENELKHILEVSCNKCKKHIEETFRDLDSEIEFALNMEAPNMRNFAFTNWKRTWGWASAIVGVIALFATNPILGAISFIAGIFSWLSDSRDKKLKNARQSMTEELRNIVDKMYNDAIKSMERAFVENIKNGMQNDAWKRFNTIGAVMLGLTNTQRELAWNYCDNHCEASKKLITNILSVKANGFSEKSEIIKQVARVPGIITVIVVTSCNIPKSFSKLIKNSIGNSEEIELLHWDSNRNSEQWSHYLLKHYNINCKIREVKLGDAHTQRITYISEKSLTNEQMNHIKIIQQLTKIHFVINNSYE